jgi:lipopolysaccharide/colanic/teichoic acid biosynthesis glycosyltransferase
MGFGGKTMKRLFDLISSFIGLLFLLPVIVLMVLLVRLKMGYPIFFKQARPGLNGEIFNMYKFRTMTNESDKNGVVKPDSVRLTKFGKFLRSTSLDELPGLWNVLKGDMSLVGPRPLLVEYLPLYSEKQSRRHEVKPGITGWAQVNGRNAISWEKKFDLDVWYVDNKSLLLDVKIIWMTIGKAFSRAGISSKNNATTDEFLGSEK